MKFYEVKVSIPIGDDVEEGTYHIPEDFQPLEDYFDAIAEFAHDNIDTDDVVVTGKIVNEVDYDRTNEDDEE